MNWETYKALCFDFPEVELSVDLSRLGLPEDALSAAAPAFAKAFEAMDALEKGAIANPDEGRRVGHYWLRDPQLAPEPELAQAIAKTVDRVEVFGADVHRGSAAAQAGPFTDLLVIGIGGSALGPQFIRHALGGPKADKLEVHFLDNTDPDGFDLALATIGDRLPTTLVVVISKSGGTVETRNCMLETQAAFERAGLDFASQAVAVTGEDSKLDRLAREQGWLERFPMWDWVGGRTSVTGPVGLLPAALQGLPIRELLEGARQMDVLTRRHDLAANPAALLALSWLHATNGKGERDMVVLPYKDRLLLFSRYLQQLLMESLGKERDLEGNIVNQGIAVYGNKGSTDQHAYVQQLREGAPNFFATFIEVLEDRSGDAPAIEVEEAVTSGDYLQGFLLGTRDALTEKSRLSITLTAARVDAANVGRLIALYERAVGLYASLVNINAYDQPGVEAGKKAAGSAIDTARAVAAYLAENAGQAHDAPAISAAIGQPEEAERVYKLARHMAANGRGSVRRRQGDVWHRDAFLVS